jgi:hypothetical protein
VYERHAYAIPANAADARSATPSIFLVDHDADLLRDCPAAAAAAADVAAADREPAFLLSRPVRRPPSRTLLPPPPPPRPVVPRLGDWRIP